MASASRGGSTSRSNASVRAPSPAASSAVEMKKALYASPQPKPCIPAMLCSPSPQPNASISASLLIPDSLTLVRNAARKSAQPGGWRSRRNETPTSRGDRAPIRKRKRMPSTRFGRRRPRDTRRRSDRTRALRYARRTAVQSDESPSLRLTSPPLTVPLHLSPYLSTSHLTLTCLALSRHSGGGTRRRTARQVRKPRAAEATGCTRGTGL